MRERGVVADLAAGDYSVRALHLIVGLGVFVGAEFLVGRGPRVLLGYDVGPDALQVLVCVPNTRMDKVSGTSLEIFG